MTFSSLWTPASTQDAYSDHYPGNGYYAGERGDTGGYSYGPIEAPKWKASKKADKKQAAMSALTLIAFLFFLNILQNCLKEQMMEDEDKHEMTIEMMEEETTSIEAKEPLIMNDMENQFLERVDIVNSSTKDNVKFRKLLSIEEDETHETLEKRDRSAKFIHDFRPGSPDWTNDLSQVTNEDLDRQKEKLNQLRELWNRQKPPEPQQLIQKEKPSMESEIERIKVKKFINNPVLSDIRTIPKLSQYWDSKKTTTLPPETKSVDFETPKKKVADFHEFEVLNGSNPPLMKQENSIVNNIVHTMQTEESQLPISENPRYQQPVVNEYFQPIALQQPGRQQHFPYRKPVQVFESQEPTAQELRADPIGIAEPIPEPFGPGDMLNTPRYRRSDELLTTLPTIELFRPESVQVITPNPSTDPIPTATKTYHAYSHPSQITSNYWRTTTPKMEETSTQGARSTTAKFTIDSIYLTTARPMKNKNSPPSYNNHWPYYKPATRYRYSPNRRVSYEPPLVRQEYYPMSVVGQYAGDSDEPNLGIINLIWTLISSFARPIAKLVPNISKVSGEARCFDLLACEAQRLGRYMGPTAQALATTFSTVLSWASPDPDRALMDAAINAGRENSCVQQIATCDERSGGKSAMTMVAQLMEIQQNSESREPRSFVSELHSKS